MSADAAYAAARDSILEALSAGARTLSFEKPEFRDLTELPPEIGLLTKLRSLSLAGARVADLAPLQALTKLQALWLNDTGVADLAPLQALTNLETLSLNDTGVADFAPLQALTNLQTLWLDRTGVADLAPLQALTNLETLSLNDTGVADLAPLQALTKLQALWLARTRVADLAPLQALTDLRTLSLDGAGIADLAPLRALVKLQELGLDGTRVADLAALRALVNLQYLLLDGTRIADLAPLQALTNLAELHIEGTPFLSDLRPIREMQSLVRGAHQNWQGGLHYRGCGACALDPEGLGKLAAIEDRAKRTERTLAYLRDLADWPPAPPAPPAQDDVLRVAPNADGKLDVAPVHPGPDEADERLKRMLYQRLRRAFADLAQATGNRQPDVGNRARAVAEHMPEDFAQADLVEIYLDIDWARGVFDRRGEREGEDRLGNAAVAALGEILTSGPGIVLDNAEVEKLEERRRRFDADPLSPEAAAAQQKVVVSIAVEPAAFGATLRAHAGASGEAAPDGADRRGVVQRVLSRNTVIAAGKWLAEEVTSEFVKKVVVPPVALWLLQNHVIIQTAALGWGEMFLAWLGPVFDQARAIAAAAQAAGAIRPTPPRNRPPRD